MNDLTGKKIRCLGMVDDPDPIPDGTEGTIYHVGGGVINVIWDNGRRLGLIEGVDRYEILD
jgi:hypothetical protein